MESELVLMQLIRSLCEGITIIIIQLNSLNHLVLWFFALEHDHYAFWPSVHIRDMKALSITHSSIFSEFQKVASLTIYLPIFQNGNGPIP